MDKAKIALAAAVLVGGVVAYYYWSEGIMILRVGAVLLGCVGALLIFWTTASGKEFFAYSQESIEETKRVVWPNRKETMQTTGIVFAFVVIMAIFLGLLDSGLALAFKSFLGWGAD